MERIECDVKGFEDLVVIMPEPLLVRHHEAYIRGARQASLEFGPTTSAYSEWFLGMVELCEIENAPEGEPLDWPLEIFNFIVEEIYVQRFREVLHPQKKTSSKPPTTPKAKK